MLLVAGYLVVQILNLRITKWMQVGVEDSNFSMTKITYVVDKFNISLSSEKVAFIFLQHDKNYTQVWNHIWVVSLMHVF